MKKYYIELQGSGEVTYVNLNWVKKVIIDYDKNLFEIYYNNAPRELYCIPENNKFISKVNELKNILRLNK